MRLFLAGLAIAALGACTMPGIDYTARVPAESYAASQYRDVTVEPFQGPGGRNFTRRFAAMLDNVTFDGMPWFRHDAAYGDEAPRAGAYSGYITIDHVDENDYYRTRKKCVEWDGLFDCERREEVEQHCIDRRVDLTVYTQLLDERTGQSVYESRHSGSASDGDCHDVDNYAAHAGYAGGRAGGLFYGRSAPQLLVDRALTDTLYAIRREIAPANIRARAVIVTEAIDPVARADPRFQHAVEATKSGNVQLACNIWQDMSAEFPEAPGVLHNQGACAEALGDYPGAQSLYARAAELVAGAGDETILKALARISARRTDTGILAELTGETPLPVVTGDPAPES